VTHERELAFGIADRMAMMAGGEILFVGTPEEIKRSPDPRIHEFTYARLPTSHVPPKRTLEPT
jgi:phospholipid/cholesterol/gamma-HCH transport system ATP-binding protein